MNEQSVYKVQIEKLILKNPNLNDLEYEWVNLEIIKFPPIPTRLRSFLDDSDAHWIDYGYHQTKWNFSFYYNKDYVWGEESEYWKWEDGLEYKHGIKTSNDGFDDFINIELVASEFERFDMSPYGEIIKLRTFTNELCNKFLEVNFVYNVHGDKLSDLDNFQSETFQEYIFYRPYENYPKTNG